MKQLTGEQYLTIGCVAYVAAAEAIAPREFSSFLIQYALVIGAALPLLLLVAFAGLGIMENPRAPFSAIREALRGSIAAGALTAALFTLSITAFTTLKFEIPQTVPFYADPWIADIDRAIHGGQAWRLAHAYVPSWMPVVIDILYSHLWFIEWFGIFFFVAFWKDRDARARYLWAFSLTLLIVGTLLATLLSSVGPILYDQIYGGTRFAELVGTLKAGGNDSFLGYADYLLAAYRHRETAFGTGISAMPSVHVAMAVLNAWFLASLDRRLGVAGWLFAAAILFGSIYSGWHYAIDGYASAVVASAIWLVCAHFRREPAAGAVSVPAVPAGR